MVTDFVGSAVYTMLRMASILISRFPPMAPFTGCLPGNGSQADADGATLVARVGNSPLPYGGGAVPSFSTWFRTNLYAAVK
jgi:hypothetical protein